MSSSTNQTWDDYFNEVEAEFETEQRINAPNQDEQRYQERVEAAKLVQKITGRKSRLPLAPDASAKEVVERAMSKTN